MSRQAAPPETRASRRRRHTRARLIAAARRIIAWRGGLDGVPIAEITAEADVATGSFYNHFESKEQLFEAVITATLERYGEILDEVTAQASDVAEACAIGIRLTLRMVKNDPVWGGFVVHTGLYIAHLRSSLLQRLAGDLYRGFDSGRFRTPERQTSLALVGGAVLGAMFAERQNLIPDGADSLAAEQLLELLGVPGREAAEIARRPLPPVPEAGERDGGSGSWTWDLREGSAIR